MHEVSRNPFLLLGLTPAASVTDIERAGQKILGLLKLGVKQGAQYDTPSGVQERTETDVREAMAALRDPLRRVYHEIWYAAVNPPAVPAPVPDEQRANEAPTGQQSRPYLFKLFGFRR